MNGNRPATGTPAKEACAYPLDGTQPSDDEFWGGGPSPPTPPPLQRAGPPGRAGADDVPPLESGPPEAQGVVLPHESRKHRLAVHGASGAKRRRSEAHTEEEEEEEEEDDESSYQDQEEEEESDTSSSSSSSSSSSTSSTEQEEGAWEQAFTGRVVNMTDKPYAIKRTDGTILHLPAQLVVHKQAFLVREVTKCRSLVPGVDVEIRSGKVENVLKLGRGLPRGALVVLTKAQYRVARRDCRLATSTCYVDKGVLVQEN